MFDARRLAAIPAGRRTKWVVLLAWVAIAAVAFPLGGRLTSVQRNDAASYLPRNAESTRVNRQLAGFPDSGSLTAVVVYRRETGLTAADRARAAADRDLLARRYPAGQPTPAPVRSPDGKALVTSIPLPASDASDAETRKLLAYVDDVRRTVGGGQGGLQVAVTGPAGYTADLSEVVQDIDTRLLLATALVVALLLILTYRSPLLWLVPLTVVGVASQVAMAAVYGLAEAGLVVNSVSQGILTVLVFGAGTDYALLLVARYREELRRHADKHDAMAEALRGAGPAIVASGTTVTLGLLCLLAAQLNSFRGLGPVGAAGIVCALAAMLTLLPALLVILGRRVFWPFVPRVGAAHTEEAGVWGRVGRAIRRRPRPVWALTTLALAVMAFGLAGAEVGLGQDQQFRTTPDAVVGQRLLRASFPPGAADPTVVTARAESAAAVLRAVRTTEGVAAARPAGQAGGLTRIAATLRAEPGEAASRDTVDRLRERVHAVPGAGAVVGGAAAIDLDVARTSWRDQAVVIPLVLAVVLVILALLLRALSAPLLLVATVIVSFAAALGASAVVFERLFGFPALDASVPLYSFVFLVALGIDYNIFLMTRVREESRRAGTRAGTLRGLAVTGGVITSAGIVLAATFAVLGVLPLVLLTQIGFVVAFGVLLDTLIVRSVLVPALAFDLDRRIWWPSRLAAPRQPAPPAPAPAQPAHSAPRS
jgi:RND superfamily putative drug exporter